jgi:hypothetical protein
MKRIEGTTKKINYFGVELCVNRDRYLATDENGCLYSHNDKPEPRLGYDWWESGGGSSRICLMDLEGMDWKDTLIDLEEV